MAAYNFPNSPSDGDTVTSNGITYTYSSSKTRWDGAAPSGSSTTVYATIDDLPLSGASTGDQAYVSGNNRLYIWNGTGWYNIALINTTPSISGASSSYILATDGTATTVTITATDPEGIPITYSIASDTSGNVATVTQGTGANTNVFTITPSTNTANAGTFSLTFRASDGVNIATAVSSFELLFSVANSNYTTALITSVGANNAVNNSFIDSSTNSHTITANGNVTQNTFSPYRHGGYSTYFDGSGDYLSVPYDAGFNMGATTDFTMEAWVYQINQTGNHTIFSQYNGSGTSHSAANGHRWIFWIDDGAVQLYQYPDMTTQLLDSGTLNLNTWNHVAVTREGSVFRLFVNGTQVDTFTSSTIEIGFLNDPLTVGSYNATGYFNGRISDVRVVKGTAVYTSAFTPPTERLTAITNTSLLACHLPYIADGSTNNHSITVNGNTKTESFSPYDYDTYSATDNGGSIYFDGNGDYLSVADGSWNTLGSSDFTIECWAYNTATSGSRQDLFGQGNSAGQAFSISTELYINSNRTVGGGVYVGSQAYLTSTATVPVNTWNHIVLARDGTTMRLYINGVQSATTSVGTGTVTDQSTDFSIGRVGEYNGLYFNGNISDFRFVKGTCEYPNGTTFTPPTAPLTAITNTSLLINGTNAGIIDKSQSAKTITLNGDVKSSTTQSKYLNSSMAFDGNGDIILFDASDPLYNLSYGQGDFTLEGWFYFNSLSNNPKLYIDAASTSTYWQLYYVNNTGLTFRANNTGINVNAGSTLSVNTWYHIAFVRNSSTYNIYVDGTSVVSTTTTHQIGSNGEKALGGSVLSGATYSVNGYISDFRITKGLARYTSNFTPPTAALQG